MIIVLLQTINVNFLCIRYFGTVRFAESAIIREHLTETASLTLLRPLLGYAIVHRDLKVDQYRRGTLSVPIDENERLACTLSV